VPEKPAWLVEDEERTMALLERIALSNVTDDDLRSLYEALWFAVDDPKHPRLIKIRREVAADALAAEECNAHDGKQC
jgi:hypothetical protein